MPTTYTQQDKDHAVALYLEHDLAEAHHRTGIPKPTLRRWLTDAGHEPSEHASHAAAKTRAANAAHREQIMARRIALQREMLATAEHCTIQARHTDEGRDAQGWMTAGAIALDKVRLELGEVTDRTEHRTTDQVTAEVERLAEQLATNDGQ